MAHLTNFVTKSKKIIGVAANYKSLIKLLQRPVPKSPDIFLKPSTSYITEGEKIVIPKGFSVNEEIELGVIIGRKGKFIKEENALEYVGGYCIAFDMTATCRMKEARSKGGSWTLGKGFDTACPVSNFIPADKIKNPHNINLQCFVNNQERQNGNTNDMIFNIPSLIQFISQYITLEENDLIITGSPPGMGPVFPGDIIVGEIKDVVRMTYRHPGITRLYVTFFAKISNACNEVVCSKFLNPT